MMANRIGVLVALLAATSLTASWLTRPPTTRTRPSSEAKPSLAAGSSPIGDLDRCLQERLHDGEAFGMARIPVVSWHTPSFQPETPEELRAVEGLREAGVAAGFYLGGRRLLEREGPLTESEEARSTWVRRVLSKPVYLTDPRASSDLPRSQDLWTHGRKALAAFATTDTYTSSLGRWTIEARPVRADRQDCLGCHAKNDGPSGRTIDGDGERPLRIGDALGVIIYVYAQAHGER